MDATPYSEALDRISALEADLAAAQVTIAELRKLAEAIADGEGDPQEMAWQTLGRIDGTANE